MATKMEEGHKGVEVVGFWVSLYTHRVRWALSLKGIQYEYIEEDIDDKGPLLSQLNPIYGKVPVLVHDGKPLPESRVILEYIDEIWKNNPLLPQDPYERAQARFWARFADEKLLLSAWQVMFTEGEKQEAALKTAMENMERMEQKLMQQGKIFFGGDNIGYLDLVLGHVACILAAWEEVASAKVLDPCNFPAMAAWTTNFLNHPVIKAEYLPPMDETIAFYQQRKRDLLPRYIARLDSK